MNLALSTRFQGYAVKPQVLGFVIAKQQEQKAAALLKSEGFLYRLADEIILSITRENAIATAYRLKDIINQMGDASAQEYYRDSALAFLDMKLKEGK